MADLEIMSREDLVRLLDKVARPHSPYPKELAAVIRSHLACLTELESWRDLAIERG
ncbi:Uncharacterised protein [Mycobacteroides abscessus subsp. abscessus]|uniref:hypothetical protein n=1 Tax=Mycobacteroides abscessus TaxID=36809 RepID=UPI000926FE09|nr:hypothetical protein [Mycobacteroides abscessus]SHU65869.1 Uncharacterised protein [Mycobacteroides abscessus subsp. abscessus]